MQYFAKNVWEKTQELHKGCGGSITFKGVPVMYEHNYVEVFRETMIHDMLDFVFVPALGAACITSYGATHLMTRTRSRYVERVLCRKTCSYCGGHLPSCGRCKEKA
jgi:hypothetical protein